jgi:hypothetical protein
LRISLSTSAHKAAKEGDTIYPRWQSQKRANNRIYWAAQLVGNKWVNGAARQRHFAYLGGIAEHMKGDAEARHRFWTKATAALKKLKLKAADPQKIETALAARAKRPTSEQIKTQRLRGLDRSLRQAQQCVQEIKVETRAVQTA